jgi:hypothetical protein
MAFVIEQQFNDVRHQYDPEGDVLYISFGPPVPAVTIDVEGWLAIRLVPNPPRLSGFTFIGFKRLFSKIRPDLIRGIPERVSRIKKARFHIGYSDESDTLIFRFEDEKPAYYEAFENYIYLEKSLFSSDIIGFKITHYTNQGINAIETLVTAMLDALFAPPDSPSGPVNGLTRAFIEHLDLPKLVNLST